MLHVAFATIFAVSFALTAADESRKFTRFKIEIPDGWHYKEVIDDKVESCFISVEDIDKEGKFSSGLSIIVRKDFREKNKLNGASYILLETANLFSKDGLVFKSYLSKIGDHGFVCNVRYVNCQIPTDVIEVFCVYLEDAKRDQLVTVVVEAPEQTFESTLQAMLPTMKNINLE